MTSKKQEQGYILEPVIFIVSPPRSGSTLLRNMLAGNPALFSPPELYLLPFNDLKERAKVFRKANFWHLKKGLIQTFMQLMQLSFDDAESFVQSLVDQNAPTKSVYALIQSMLNGKILVDKSPLNAHSVINLKSALNWFVRPVFIHLHRHPYSAVDSTIRQNRERIKQGINAKGEFTKVKKISKRQYHKMQIESELIWLNCHLNALQIPDEVPKNRYIRVGYENMVAEPEKTMQKICKRLNLDYDAKMVTPYKQTKNSQNALEFSQRTFPLGDPGFYKHKKIDRKVAERWQNILLPQPIGRDVEILAKHFGYTLPEWQEGFDYEA